MSSMREEETASALGDTHAGSILVTFRAQQRAERSTTNERPVHAGFQSNPGSENMIVMAGQYSGAISAAAEVPQRHGRASIAMDADQEQSAPAINMSQQNAEASVSPSTRRAALALMQLSQWQSNDGARAEQISEESADESALQALAAHATNSCGRRVYEDQLTDADVRFCRGVATGNSEFCALLNSCRKRLEQGAVGRDDEDTVKLAVKVVRRVVDATYKKNGRFVEKESGRMWSELSDNQAMERLIRIDGTLVEVRSCKATAQHVHGEVPSAAEENDEAFLSSPSSPPQWSSSKHDGVSDRATREQPPEQHADQLPLQALGSISLQVEEERLEEDDESAPIYGTRVHEDELNENDVRFGQEGIMSAGSGKTLGSLLNSFKTSLEKGRVDDPESSTERAVSSVRASGGRFFEKDPESGMMYNELLNDKQVGRKLLGLAGTLQSGSNKATEYGAAAPSNAAVLTFKSTGLSDAHSLADDDLFVSETTIPDEARCEAIKPSGASNGTPLMDHDKFFGPDKCDQTSSKLGVPGVAVTDNDALFRPGIAILHALVQAHHPEYVTAKRRGRHNEVVTKVMDEVAARKWRYLKKDEVSGSWFPVDDTNVRQLTSTVLKNRSLPSYRIDTVAVGVHEHDLTPVDVKCGRGISHQVSNPEFHKLVGTYLQMEYSADSMKDEPVIAKKIVDIVGGKQGRYLTKDQVSGLWLPVDEMEAIRITLDLLRRLNEARGVHHTALTKSDVLFVKGVQHDKVNKQFHALVGEYYVEFCSAGNEEEETAVARKLMNAVIANNLRYRKRNNQTRLWVLIRGEEALQKTKAALSAYRASETHIVEIPDSDDEKENDRTVNNDKRSATRELHELDLNEGGTGDTEVALALLDLSRQRRPPSSASTVGKSSQYQGKTQSSSVESIAPSTGALKACCAASYRDP